jgi:limonene-1,2-epoxide hydrolase
MTNSAGKGQSELTADVIDEERIVREVLAMWGQGLQATKDSWRRHCDAEMEWYNNARGSIVGLDNRLSAIDQMFAQLEIAYVKTPIRSLHATTGLVYAERSDDMYRADGTLIAAVPVVAVVALTDGKISQWRDYCDDWLFKLELATGTGGTAHRSP